MTAAELLSDLRARGVRLAIDGERVAYDARAGGISPADLERLRTHKTELLAYLRADPYRPLLETACHGLAITPEQLREELEIGGDLPDLVSDALDLSPFSRTPVKRKRGAVRIA